MEKQDQEYKNFSAEEEAFRRGYTHGVIAAESGVTLQEAYAWRNSSEEGCPPGTPGFGSKMFTK